MNHFDLTALIDEQIPEMMRDANCAADNIETALAPIITENCTYRALLADFGLQFGIVLEGVADAHSVLAAAQQQLEMHDGSRCVCRYCRASCVRRWVWIGGGSARKNAARQLIPVGIEPDPNGAVYQDDKGAWQCLSLKTKHRNPECVYYAAHTSKTCGREVTR